MAEAEPQFDAKTLKGTVPTNDTENPGVPAWLYIAAQSDKGGPIDIYAFLPFRAYWAMAPGGVMPPPPLP